MEVKHLNINTDSEGKVLFVVPRGNYYQIEFPEYAKA